MAGRRALSIAISHGWLLVLWAGVAAAQTSAPLRKTDLVRLLTNPGMTKAQVAERVRGSCLAFDPTGRDRTDLVAMGADGGVMAAIDECVRRKAEAGRAPAQQPPAATRPTPQAAGAGLRIVALQQRASAAAGAEAVLQVLATRDGRPAPRVELTLRGGGQQVRAITDARGVATFRVPAGTAVGVRRVAVVPAGNEGMTGAPEVELETLPGPPAVAEVEPRRLEVRPAEPAARRQVTVTVRDAHGNAVPGERVEFRPVTPGVGINAFTGQTNRSGQLSATFPTNTLRRTGEVAIFVRGERWGALFVVVGPLVISEAQTRFVSGEGQQGVVGQPLGQPLVLEVRDTSGMAVVGEAASFGATNGDVSPTSATTDGEGRVSVSVTLGRQAGTTRVMAGVGGIRKEATIPVAPGPAAALVIRQDTVPVAGSLVVRTRQPVLLRVAARDSFGNEVPASRLGATVRGQGVLRVARVQAEGGAGRVELHPQATGSANIDLEAAGVRQTLAAEVLLPVAGAGWMVAVRGGWAPFEYNYTTIVQGHPGFLGEVILGRGLGHGLTLALGATVASLEAERGSVRAPVSLLDGSLRLEYAIRPRARVSPVVSIGGGRFQTRSETLGDDIRHSSLFWLAGAGLDFNLRERMTIELRVATHQLHEATTVNRKARMGSLLALTAGVRLGN